ncbi:Integrase [Tenacibaculum maritimum]|nr:site-specific integrase [Tenacibaculum maritimum]CAA0163033.1 Integrase [Tenacibaculum maritimum]CAA0173544.1 Integrase [Tenacibaculum maritimum]
MTTINIILRNKKNRTGEQPVIMRITKNRKSKIISLGLTCKNKDWDTKKNEFKRTYPNASQRNRVLLKLNEKALRIIDEFSLEEIDFTLNQFEERFRDKSSKSISASEFWLEKIEDLNIAGRTGNANAYKDVYNSFFKFRKDKSILFRDITPTILDKYETYLRSNNNTDGGIAFKMREIRAIFNDAIRKGIVQEKYYPFKKYKISKLKGRNIKKALTRKEMRLLETIDTNINPHLIDSKNYMIFSYYTGGMNFIDMLKLTWNDIDDERINYTRSKTKKNFSIQILEPVKQVLEYYKKQNRTTRYVFPILLKENLTPKQIDNRKHKTLRKFNKDLKEIAYIQSVNKNVSSYTIRHSFATNLKFAGVSTDVISDAMGHSNSEITNAYLKRHSNETVDNEMRKLLEEPNIEYNIAS